MTVLVPTKNQNLDVLDIFREMDIPIVVNGAENYFQTTEISVMMSLLQVIDNPHQDIRISWCGLSITCNKLIMTEISVVWK